MLHSTQFSLTSPNVPGSEAGCLDLGVGLNMVGCGGLVRYISGLQPPFFCLIFWPSLMKTWVASVSRSYSRMILGTTFVSPRASRGPSLRNSPGPDFRSDSPEKSQHCTSELPKKLELVRPSSPNCPDPDDCDEGPCPDRSRLAVRSWPCRAWVSCPLPPPPVDVEALCVERSSAPSCSVKASVAASMRPYSARTHAAAISRSITACRSTSSAERSRSSRFSRSSSWMRLRLFGDDAAPSCPTSSDPKGGPFLSPSAKKAAADVDSAKAFA
mmetsp:Transcript_42399/g.95949  ORF Transcript_42399/g.95949 Transcript_42399/m.95949 type:complete len:271 (+) Transcript_42399:341-1153(+)